MRVLGVFTSGIGGLSDGWVTLPESSVVALAGGNGTGKSKLLACLLSPWSQVLPAARTGQGARVSVQIQLTAVERNAFEAFSRAMQWGEVSIPEIVTMDTSFDPLGGSRRESTPMATALLYGFAHQNLMQQCPSLDVVYLPAERRLVQSSTAGIDLQQLSEIISLQKTAEPRQAVQNYGRLDDQEFEQFAKALCVAASLPDEEPQTETVVTAGPRPTWAALEGTVNAIIAPKRLLPLSRQYPDSLRIRTPSGDTHPVQDLSSGERQALIIASRVMRAGADHGTVLIDEPDAYLHPQLNQRLIQALEAAVGTKGQLVVATHSPSILDSLPPSSILRLGHGEAPRLVADEADRVEMYRSAGFRASSLTQSDLLVVVEGESDQPLLGLLIPELGRASVREAGGRSRVLQAVEQLAPLELPVLGVVDGDVLAPAPPTSIEHLVTVWPAGDIEGVLLSDAAVLQVMIDLGLIRSTFASMGALRNLLDELLAAMRDNITAELAQKTLRTQAAWRWPSPRGGDAVGRLRSAALALKALSPSTIDEAIDEAEATWDALEGDARWSLARGKYLANPFAARASEMRSGRALLEAAARHRPPVAGIQSFKASVLASLTPRAD